jgi:hypothetical protein
LQQSFAERKSVGEAGKRQQYASKQHTYSTEIVGAVPRHEGWPRFAILPTRQSIFRGVFAVSSLRCRQSISIFTPAKKFPRRSRFEARQFQEMLQRGHVDSVTLFSKCHHGMSYHDTESGVRHPHMQEELLPQQIEACRAIDVKTPIYISAGLMKRWPWRTRSGQPKQRRQGYDPLKASGNACASTRPYLDYLCAQ